MVGARGFEPPTPWSRTIWIENLNRFRGVAYGPVLVLSSSQMYRNCAEFLGGFSVLEAGPFGVEFLPKARRLK
jgi:hypothetical protein